ncbi:MAG TPA: HEAT repeat domain-containing protein, partial [Kofleriaceae bacterium]|nr:HEAT repeat domain-containing protein [Kofleriaceae bacterium]
LAGAARRIVAAGDADRARAADMTRALAAAAIRRALRAGEAATRRAGIAAAQRAVLRAAAEDLRALASAGDPAQQRDAVRALGAIGDADAVPALLVVVGERGGAESAATSAAAAEALAVLGKGKEARGLIAQHLAGADKEDRAHALAVAAQIGIPEGLATLTALAGNQATPRQERVAACAAVALAGAAAASAQPADRAAADIALRALRRGLDAGDAAVRASCAGGVATLAAAGARSKATYWKLVELLSDRDERVRAGALLAAIRLDPDAIGKELYAIAREKSPVVLAAHAEGLAVLPGPAAYDRLVTLAHHDDVDVRRRAAASLARRPEKPAREQLAGLIHDADPQVQLLALDALDSADAIAPLADGGDPQVRAAAFARLVAMRGQEAMIGALCARLADDDLDEGEAARLAAAWLKPAL